MNAPDMVALLGLLVMVLLLDWSQRRLIREIGKDVAKAQTATNSRVEALGNQFSALPLTHKRMADAVRDGYGPLNARLDATDLQLAEIHDMLASLVNANGNGAET